MDDQTQRTEIESYLSEFQIEWPNGYGAGESFAALNIPNMAGFKFVIGTNGKVVWNNDSRGSIEYGIQKALGR